MNSEIRKIISGVIVFFMAAGMVSATGYLRSQSGSVILQPQDNQVLPSSDNSMELGGPGNRWHDVYAVNLRGGDYQFFYTTQGSSWVDWKGFRLYSVNSSGQTRGVFEIRPRDDGTVLYPFNSSSTVPQKIISYGGFIPLTGNYYDLGGPVNRWANVYANRFWSASTNTFFTLPMNGVLWLNYTGFYGAFCFTREGNLSRAAGFLQTNETDPYGRKGLIYLANYVDGQRIIPESNNIYELGSSDRAWKTVYAYTYVDRTPFMSTENLVGEYNKTAVQFIKGIKADVRGNLDHSSLPDFVRVKESLSSTTEAGLKVIPAGDSDREYGRDIGASVSLNTVGIQELDSKSQDLEKRIAELEAQLQALKDGDSGVSSTSTTLAVTSTTVRQTSTTLRGVSITTLTTLRKL